MSGQPGRPWGYWTQLKLAILADYLSAFLRASSGKATEFVYLDAFAGEGIGTDRLTGEEFNGSARIALETAEAGGFTRLRYFEQAARAKELRDKLLAEYPDRNIKVYGGDCNAEIPKALAKLEDVKWAPTFAFIDPDGMQFAWQTLEHLAAHKWGYRTSRSSKPEYKVELWLLFPTQGLIRTLALDERRFQPADGERATKLYGTEDWRAIYDRRVAGDLKRRGRASGVRQPPALAAQQQPRIRQDAPVRAEEHPGRARLPHGCSYVKSPPRTAATTSLSESRRF